MKLLLPTLALAAVVPLAATPSFAQTGGVVSADGTLRTYGIGNSLTRGLSVGNGTTGNRLQQLFAGGGVDYTYGTQLGAGLRLYQHLDQNNGGGSGTTNFNNENSVGAPAFGDYDNALRNFTFDAVVLQPFQNKLDFTPAANAAADRQFVIGDRQAANALLDYARGTGPRTDLPGRYFPPDFNDGDADQGRFDLNNPNVRPQPATSNFFIYETWPTVPGVYARTASDRFSDFWTAPYDAALPAEQTVPNRDFFDQLVTAVNADNPDLAAPVRVIPVGEVLYELDLAIRAGSLPGLEAFYARPEVEAYFADARDADGDGVVTDDFPFDGFDRERGVLNFYADNIHLNDQPHNGADSGTIGAYVAALTHYAVLTGESPVGLTAEPYELLDPTLDAELIAALQRTVFDVVTSDPNTGVQAIPEPAAAAAIGGATLLALGRRSRRSAD